MENYGYGNEVDPQLVELIVRRATVYGFRKSELEDAIQHVLLGLMKFRFDPAKSNGCQETTALTAVINNRLLKLRRTEVRYRVRQERTEARSGSIPDTVEHLKVEVRQALVDLSPLQRRICESLGQGYSTRETASRVQCSWHAVERHVAHIRGHFRKSGLDHWFGE